MCQKKRKEIRKMARKVVKEEAKAEKLQQKQQQKEQKQIEQQQRKELERQHKQSSATPAEAEKKGFFSRLRNRLKHGDQPTSEEAKKTVLPSAQQLSKDVTKPQVQPPPIAAAVSTKEAKKSAKEIQQENIAGNVIIVYHNSS